MSSDRSHSPDVRRPAASLGRRKLRVRRVRRSRKLLVESLETRRVMASLHRNSFDEFDVNDDGFTSPIDALLVINELNDVGSHALTGAAAGPFLDVSGDSFVAPIDALLVINLLNDPASAERLALVEQGTFGTQGLRTVRVSETAGQRRTLRFDLSTRFDSPTSNVAPGDQVLVYLVDPAQPDQTLVDRGAPGTAVFSLIAGVPDFAPGQVRYDGRSVEIDVTQLAAGASVAVKLQLLDADGARGSRVVARNFTANVSRATVASAELSDATTVVAPGGAVDVSSWTASSSVAWEFANPRYDATAGRYRVEARARGDAAGLGRDVALVIPGLPVGATLVGASGTTSSGAPFVNFRPAIAAGGLESGSRSDAIELTIDDPARRPLSLSPHTLVGQANRPPVLAAVPEFTVRPGGRIDTQITASDPDGDATQFRLEGDVSGLNVTLAGDGRLIVAPTPAQLGDHTFAIVATDGVASSSRSITVHVVDDPTGTTRVSGQILETTGAPLAGLVVQIGGVQGLTGADGRFLLDLGVDAVVATTIKIRGDLLAGPRAFPFIAEHLSLTLEHEVYRGYENQIVRPIYLPELDVANGRTINPLVDATVTTPALPGVSVFVQAGTLMNQQGSPFTGNLSITAVPTDLTPIALPEDLHPDLVVTIQPGEMVFASPAPMTFPNSAGWDPGTLMDLWSINPATGQFDDVGDMQVSADGQSIVTISGGVRNSSWHFTTTARMPPVDKTKKKCGCDCPPCESKESTGLKRVELPSGWIIEPPQPWESSEEVEIPELIRPFHEEHVPSKAPASVGSASGGLSITRYQITYRAQGEDRGTSLVYDSLRADPRPIVRVGLALNPDPNSTDRIVGRLEMSRGGTTIVADGAAGGSQGLVGGENFFRGNPNDFLPDLALQVDLTNQPTGVYAYSMQSGGRQFDGQRYVGRSDVTTGSTIVVNSRNSPFGAGWGLADWEQLQVESDGSVLIVDGGGGERFYRRVASGTGFAYLPLDGDFSTLQKLGDGSYLHRTPELVASRFAADGRLESVTQSDGRQTRYEYDASRRLVKLIDSVGKETRFEYQGNRVARIIDPADRTTNLEYDAAGNLLRVVDPDGVTSRYQYDSQHRLVAQTDERGSVTRFVYGFDGRMRQAQLPDGTSMRFAPLESQGLFPVSLTRNPATAPSAPSSANGVRTLLPDGSSALAALSPAGQSLGRTDDLGSYAYGRNSAGQVTSAVNGRGQVTLYTYDARGGVTSIEQELPGSGALVGGFSGPGEADEYFFHGTVGQVLYYDALDDLDADGVKVELLQPTGDALVGSPFGGVADRDDGPFVLREEGEYRLRLRGGAGGDYRFRLLDVTAATPIVAGGQRTVTLGGDDEHDLTIVPIDAVAGRRLRIEGVDGADARVNWDLSSLDGRPVASSATGQTLDVVLAYTGRYLLTMAKSSTAPAGGFDYSFRLVDATPAVATPRSGFGEFSGSIAPGEVDRYEFTTPGGRSLFVSSLVQDFSFSLNSTLVFPSGRRVSTAIDFLTAEPLAFPLFEPGTYAIEIAGRRATSSGSYRLEWRDVADASTPLALDTPVDLTLAPGATRVFSFPAVAGDRQFLQYLTHFDARVSVVELNPYGNTRRSPDSRFTGTHYLLLKLDPDAAPLDLSFRLDSLAAAPALSVGTPIDGVLTPTDPAAYFKFTATAGERLYVDGATDGAGVRRVLLPPGDAPFQFGALASAEGYVDLPVTGEYVLAVANTAPPLFGDSPFSVSLTRPPTHDVAPLPIGERLVDEIMAPGELRTYEASLPTGRYFAWAPSIGPRVTLSDVTRTFELPRSGPFSLDASSTPTRLEVGGTSALGTYEYSLLSLDTAPVVTAGGASDPFTLHADRAVALLRATVAAGRRYSLHLANLTGGGFASWKAYDETDKLVGDSSLGVDWEFTTVGAGEWTFVFENFDGGDEATFTPELVDVTGTLPARTPTGTVLSGTLAPDAEQTWTFTFRAGDVVQIDRQDGFEAPTALWTGPDNTEYFVGTDEQTSLVVPTSGTYVLTIHNGQATDADYRFRVQNLTADSTPLVDASIRLGTLSSGEARDLFRFDGAAGEVVLLDSISDNLFTTSELKLFDARGESMELSSDEPVRLPATGVYYVAVTGGSFASGSEPFDYAFRLLRLADPSAAPPITVGATTDGQLAGPSARQLYRVTAAAGERLALVELGLPVLGPAILYDSLGRVVPWTETDGYVLWTVPYDGDYVIALDTFFTPPPAYSIRVTNPQLDRRPFEAGGSVRRTFEYDSTWHRVIREVDELGRVTLRTLDPSTGNVTSVRRVVGEVGGADDAVVSYTYGPRGRVETVTDELGRVTRLTYDVADNVIEIVRAAGTPDETVERMEYDAAGRLSAFIDAEGARSEFEYDARNRPTLVRRADSDGAGPQTPPTVSYEYDLSDQVVSRVDELGRVTDWEYDALGRLVSVVDAAGQVQTLAYDALGRVSAAVDEAGQTTRYEYDSRDRLVATIDPLDQRTSYEYDGENSLVAVVDPLGRRTTAAYDVRDRTTRRTDALGQSEYFAYDGADRLVSYADVSGSVVRYAYDALDHLESVTDAVGAVTRYEHDRAGNVLSQVDPLGNTTTYAYDRLDRLVQQRDAALGATSFTYDAAGRVRSVVDPVANETLFTYDALGRQIAETNESGLTRTFAYDAAGNLVRKIDRDGRRIDYDYDVLNRLIAETWVGGGGTFEYAYDPRGLLTVANDAASRLTMTYDAAGRRTSVDTTGTTQIPAVKLQYAYDAAGRVTSVTDAPGGTVRSRVAYVYDALDRTTSLMQTGSAVSAKRVDFDYDAVGSPVSIRRYRDAATTNLAAATTLEYDDAHRLLSLVHKNAAGTTLAFETLAYDDAGRIMRTETIDGATDYAYDERGQLVAADRSTPGADESYTYDANGNRTASSRHGAAYVTGPDNRLLSDGVYQYAYDGEGHLTRRTEIATGKVREFAWDYRGRLTSVNDRSSLNGPTTQRVDYRYDALDRRIGATVTANGTTRATYFAYDREDVLYDFVDADGPAGVVAPQLATTYLHGPAVDQVLAQESAAHVVDWLLADHLGSITELVSNAGAVTNHVRYDAYGAILAQSNEAHGTRYGFTGRERDDATGLNYYRARWYDPTIGRFVSEDPIGFGGGDANLMRYVSNSPEQFVDPFGKSKSHSPPSDDLFTRAIDWGIDHFKLSKLEISELSLGWYKKYLEQEREALDEINPKFCPNPKELERKKKELDNAIKDVAIKLTKLKIAETAIKMLTPATYIDDARADAHRYAWEATKAESARRLKDGKTGMQSFFNNLTNKAFNPPQPNQ